MLERILKEAWAFEKEHRSIPDEIHLGQKEYCELCVFVDKNTGMTPIYHISGSDGERVAGLKIIRVLGKDSHFEIKKNCSFLGGYKNYL